MKMAVRIALLGALISTLWTPRVNAQGCAALTPASVANYTGSGSEAFEIDNEGMASAPLYFDLDGVPNATTGAFTGTMSTASSKPSYGTYYTANGTVTQVGTSGLSITFTYSVPNGPFIEDGMVSYTYTGSIVIADQTCDLFMAGTYTTTSTALIVGPFGTGFRTITSGPYPFSAKLVKYLEL